MSIYALEKATGIKFGTIKKWKDAVPMTSNLILVADYFSVSLDYLLGRSDNLQSHINPDVYRSAALNIAEIVTRAENEISSVLDSINIKKN